MATSSRRMLAVAALVTVGGALAASLLIEPDLPCDSDEGYHVAPALVLLSDLSHGDVIGFLRHSAKAGRYPFLHSWLVAGALGTFGRSLLVARATSAVLLGLGAGLGVLLLGRVRPGTHPLWGFALGAFVVLAPENLTMGVLCMLEVPGLALSALAAWLYHRALERPASRARPLLAGLAIAALLAVKFPSAAYVLAPIGLHELVRARGNPLRLLRPASLLVWAPPVAALGLWLVAPQTRQGIVDFLAVGADPIIAEGGRDPLAAPRIQPDLLVFYGRAVLERLAPGPVLGAAGLAGAAVLAVRRGSFATIVLLGSLVWTVFTLTLSFRTYGVDRFLVPLAGLFAVAAVGGWAETATLLARGRSRLSRVGLVLLVVVLLGGAADAAWRARDLPAEALRAVETTPEEAHQLDAILAAVPRPANLLLVGAWDQLSESALTVRRLMEHPEERATDLDVRAIRLERGYADTRTVESWFERGSRWTPDSSAPRPRFVVVMRPGETLLGMVPDRAVWARVLGRVEEEIGGRPPVAAWHGRDAAFEVHRLGD